MDTAQPSRRSPGPLTRRQRLARSVNEHRYLAVLTASALLASGIGGSVALARSGADQRPTPNPAPSLSAPADGDLKVGKRTVPQMAGACDGSSCYHVPPAHPVTVTAPKSGSVQLTAGRSRQFTVSVLNLAAPQAAAPAQVSGDTLKVGDLTAGRYQVTVNGQPRGGVWQFVLAVPKKK